MLDGNAAPAADAPAPTAADAAAPEKAAPAADAPLLSGDAGADGADGSGDGGSSAAEAAWRDDWRDRLVEKLPAAEREKELARLKRFASPENVYRSLRELERKQSTGQLKAALPDGASEEEIAAYRKAHGIPEAPDGYGLAFPDGIDVSDVDKSDLAGFSKHMHEANVPPGAVKAAFDYFVKMRGDVAQKLEAEAHDAAINAQAELRAEYGNDFKRNTAIANRFLTLHAGDGAKDLTQLRLADGTALGNHPGFVRMVVNAGIATADDDAVITTSGTGGHSDLDRYKAIMTNPKATPAEREEAQALAVKLEKRGVNFAL